MLDTYRRNDNRRRKSSWTKYVPLTLFQGFEKGYSRFACERELETEHNWIILTPNLWPSTLCLSRSQILNRRSRGHTAGWWLSLRYLISIFSGPQLIRAQRPLRPDVAFPTTSRLQLAATQLALARRTQLASVQFVGLILPSNSHAEIWSRLHASAISSDIWRLGCVTSAIFGIACVIVIERKILSCSSQVTLFRCITLKWDLHLVPFHQPISAHAISSPNCHWNVSLPSGASPWNCIFGRVKRSKYNTKRVSVIPIIISTLGTISEV